MMDMRLCLVAMLLSGCATTYEPVIDFQSSRSSQSAYEDDLEDCRKLAEEQRETALADIGRFAGFGALLGSLYDDAGQGAVIGAGTAATYSATSRQVRRENIVINCLKGRGYRVVGR